MYTTNPPKHQVPQLTNAPQVADHQGQQSGSGTVWGTQEQHASATSNSSSQGIQQHTSAPNSSDPQNNQRQPTSTTNGSISENDQAASNHSQSDQHETFNLKAFDVISATLSQGLANPEGYIVLFNKFLVHYGYPQINVPSDIFSKVNIGSNTQSTSTNTSPSTLTACAQNQSTHASHSSTTNPSSALTACTQNQSTHASLSSANVDTQTPNLLDQPPASTSTPSPKPSIVTSPSQPPIPAPRAHYLPNPSMQVSSPPSIPFQTIPDIQYPNSFLLPPHPTISRLSILAQQTLAPHTSSSSIINKVMQVTTTALALPLFANSIAPPPISQASETLQQFQLHGTPLTHLTPPDFATNPNHRHVPSPSPTTPNQSSANSNHNLADSPAISPINFIYQLFNLTSLANSKEPIQNTPKISKRHSLAAHLLIGSLNNSYKFRSQRRLNYYES